MRGREPVTVRRLLQVHATDRPTASGRIGAVACRGAGGARSVSLFALPWRRREEESRSGGDAPARGRVYWVGGWVRAVGSAGTRLLPRDADWDLTRLPVATLVSAVDAARLDERVLGLFLGRGAAPEERRGEERRGAALCEHTHRCTDTRLRDRGLLLQSSVPGPGPVAFCRVACLALLFFSMVLEPPIRFLLSRPGGFAANDADFAVGRRVYNHSVARKKEKENSDHVCFQVTSP